MRESFMVEMSLYLKICLQELTCAIEIYRLNYNFGFTFSFFVLSII